VAKKILLMDDSEIVLAMEKAVLEARGYALHRQHVPVGGINMFASASRYRRI